MSPPTIAAMRTRGRERARGSTAAGYGWDGLGRFPSSASTNSLTVANRSAFDLAMAARMAASTGTGTVARTVRMGGTGSTRCRAMTACAVVAPHGGQAVQVAPAVHLARPRRLFRAHVIHRPDRHPGPGELVASAGGGHGTG